MSAITSVVINDGQVAPVEHTYLPVQSAPTCLWRENDVTLPIAGQGNIALSLTKQKQIYKIRLQVELPVLEEAVDANSSGYTAAPKVAHIVRADVNLFAHARSLPDQRNDLMELLMNALGETQLRAAFKDLLKPF
jgi:hypothetical protein